MQMAVELDVFVGNTTIMDEEVYQFWLDGYTGTVGHTKHFKYILCLWVLHCTEEDWTKLQV